MKPDDMNEIFKKYNAAVSAGDFNRAFEFYTANTKAEILSEIKDPSDRSGYEMMEKAMLPLSYTVDHADIEEEKATLYITGTYKSPDEEQPGKTARQEVMIFFLKESGHWKIDYKTFTGDPDEVKRSPDRNFEPETRYNLNKTTSLGGRIVSVKFEKDFTLVTIRVLDEENLVFIQSKTELEKSGFDTALLVPWRILSANGHPHKTNPLKVWAESFEVE